PARRPTNGRRRTARQRRARDHRLRPRDPDRGAARARGADRRLPRRSGLSAQVTNPPAPGALVGQRLNGGGCMSRVIRLAIVAVGAVLAVSAAALAAIPGADVRLTRDDPGGGYVSNYTAVTGQPY